MNLGTPESICLLPDASITIRVGGSATDPVVRIEHITDADGGHAIQLSGVDCNLEGELPGLYYPVPISVAT